MKPCIYIQSVVMVIVAGIGYGDTSSNPGLTAFHIAWERYESNYSPSSYG